ncbi:MAG: hypothetical protein AB1679_02970 [Actinomycetota bacterium]|jgi:hypothetical protein
MTEREQEDIRTPERTHDQPAEGGREQAEQATERSTNEPEGDGGPAERVE